MKTIGLWVAQLLQMRGERRARMENYAAFNASEAPVGPAIGINHECDTQTVRDLPRPDFAPCKLPGPVLFAQRIFKARSRFFSLVRRET